MFNEKSFNLPSPPIENLVIPMTFKITLRKKKKNPRVPLNYQSLKLESRISHKIQNSQTQNFPMFPARACLNWKAVGGGGHGQYFLSFQDPPPLAC